MRWVIHFQGKAKNYLKRPLSTLQVTIHNINEAKFLRAQQEHSNGVEITRISGPSSVGSKASDSLQDALQNGESITLSELLNTPFFQNKGLGMDNLVEFAGGKNT